MKRRQFVRTVGAVSALGAVGTLGLVAGCATTGTGNVSVGRRSPLGGFRDRPTYTLYAPQSLGNLREVELRLRKLFEEAHLHASVTALHA